VIGPAVAAGHPATARAGAAILAAGGTAADAAVAMSLVSCVAETVMTGLLGGGHAIWWDARSQRARLLDCFVSVPSGTGPPMLDLEVEFGDAIVHYAVGPASCGVPGLPAGLDLLWREQGRLPWQEVCEPALRLARVGVELPPRHADCLAMLEPVMTMDEGARIYAPGGRLLEAGDRLEQPGLVHALQLVAEEGARSVYEGSIAAALLELVRERGGLVTEDDLRAYHAGWAEPVGIAYAGFRFLARGGLSGVPEALARLPPLRELRPRERVLALLDALDPLPGGDHTTNLVAVDAVGNACVLTSSLGLGSGDFLPGLDLHLNSMLGEKDLLVGALGPGDRMQSMMAPSLAVDDGGLALAIGSAGGTRLRTALVGVACAILDEGLEPQAAVDRPRVHRSDDAVVSAEPGVDQGALDELERRGFTVRRFSDLHHYFGGVSLAARAGPAADPRRSGLALAL
jgi:gamma-glutamyltranspeptidase/glutathione hydrolase